MSVIGEAANSETAKGMFGVIGQSIDATPVANVATAKIAQTQHLGAIVAPGMQAVTATVGGDLANVIGKVGKMGGASPISSIFGQGEFGGDLSAVLGRGFGGFGGFASFGGGNMNL